MKKLILIVILMIVLVGGGTFAAAKFLGIGPLVELLEKKEEKAEVKAEAPPVAEPQDFFYELGSFIVPLVNKGAVSRQIGVDLALRVAPKSGPRVSADIPRLQNAVLTELYDFMPRHSDARSPEDKQAIHDRLLKLAIRMYGEGVVRDVIIKSIYER